MTAAPDRRHRSGRLTALRRATVAAVAVALAGPVVTAAASTTFQATGILSATNRTHHTLTVRDTGGDRSLQGRSVTLGLTRTTRITRDGHTVGIAALHPGDQLTATGRHDRQGHLVASRVDAASPPQPDGAAAAVPAECPGGYYSPCTPALPPATGTATMTITISNYVFDPPVAVIPVGTLVTVRNADTVEHTFSGNHLDSGPLGTGDAYTVEFTTPGSYRFYCSIHPFMNGTLDVR